MLIIIFWDFIISRKVFKVFRKPDKCWNQKRTFFWKMSRSRFPGGFFVFFSVFTSTICGWKYRFPTIFFPKSRNTVLKIFISRPLANTMPPPPPSPSHPQYYHIVWSAEKNEEKYQETFKDRKRKTNAFIKICSVSQ